MVDGYAICSECGGAVALAAPDLWRHASPGRARRAPRITLDALRAAGSVAALRAKFPSAVCSEDERREAIRRLEAFRAGLAEAAQRAALGPGENPYLDLVGSLGGGRDGWRVTPGLGQLLDLDERRRELASLFSWAIPTGEAIALVARYGPIVECGAGTGYWSALLRARGVDVLAFDAAPPGRKSRNAYHRAARGPWSDVHRAASGAVARRHPDRTLLLCWPPFDDDRASYAVLRAYRGDVVIHVGEPDEGATGSVRFHRELALNWTPVDALDLPRWPRLRDQVTVYRRNPERRPHVERDRCFECRRFMATGAIGRCDACFARRPPALALRVGRHRVEYPQEVVDAMPPALRRAFERSPNRIR